jgi:hypothetical protein
MSNRSVYNLYLPQSAMAESFLKHHPDVTPEEAHEAWQQLRDEGVNVNDTEEVYRALHEFFKPAAGVNGTRVVLSPEQRQIARDIGCSERDYAHGLYAVEKSKGRI